jgi:hypothetical protein
MLDLGVVLPNETLLYSCLIVVGLVFVMTYPRIFCVLARELPALVMALTVLGCITYTYVSLEIASQLGPHAPHNGAVQLMRSCLVGCSTFVLLSLPLLFIPCNSTLSTSAAIKSHTRTTESLRIRFRRFVFILLVLVQVSTLTLSSTASCHRCKNTADPTNSLLSGILPLRACCSASPRV